jgi:hypothetical protein
MHVSGPWRLRRFSLPRRLSVACVPALVVLACAASDDAADPGSTDAAGSETSGDAPFDSARHDALPESSPDGSACTLSKPYSSSDADCNACAQQHCCEPVNACYADLECDDGYVNCALACALLPGDAGDVDAGIAACLADCDAQYPIGKQKYDAAIGCADTQCSVQCQ